MTKATFIRVSSELLRDCEKDFIEKSMRMIRRDFEYMVLLLIKVPKDIQRPAAYCQKKENMWE